MKNMSAGVLAAFLIVGSSQVQAVELNIYGLGHLSLDNVDDGIDSSLHVASNSSRLGLKGNHDLNDSTKLIFQFETGLDPTAQGTNDGNGPANSDGQIFTKGRPSFVGVQGNFGTVLMGHMPALDQWANDYNLFADKIGDLGNLWEASGVPGRMDNVVYYETPKFSNFSIALTHSPEEGVEDSSHTIVKGNYSAGGLKVGLAVANIGQGVGADEHEAQSLVIQYDFGQFSIGGGHQAESNIGGISDLERDSSYIASKIKVGERGSFSIQYAVSSSDATETDASQVAVGYDWILNDSTSMYIAYASMDNDENVQFAVNGKGHGDKVTPILGQDPSAISLGIVYQFDAALLK